MIMPFSRISTVLFVAIAVASASNWDDIVEDDTDSFTVDKIMDSAAVHHDTLDVKEATKKLGSNADVALRGDMNSRDKAEAQWTNRLGDMLEESKRVKNAPRERMHKMLEKASDPKPEKKHEEEEDDDSDLDEYDVANNEQRRMNDMEEEDEDMNLIQIPDYITSEEDFDAYMKQQGKTVTVTNQGIPEHKLSESDKSELNGMGFHAKDGRLDSQETELLQIPKYITSEEDLDAYLKQQGSKVVQDNQGVPEDELSEKDRAELHEVTDKESPLTTLLQIPKYITSEDDLDAYLKQQGTQVIHHSMGVSENDLSEEDKADLKESMKVKEDAKPWDEALKIDAVVPEDDAVSALAY